MCCTWVAAGVGYVCSLSRTLSVSDWSQIGDSDAVADISDAEEATVVAPSVALGEMAPTELVAKTFSSMIAPGRNKMGLPELEHTDKSKSYFAFIGRHFILLSIVCIFGSASLKFGRFPP